MRIAVLSDIHSNLVALDAVLDLALGRRTVARGSRLSAVPVRPARGRGVQREPEAFRARLLTGTDWFKHYYTGERVAILATGSEAASILPEVLHTAASVMVFEESPTWVTPVPVPLGPLRRTVSRIWLRASVPDAGPNP